MMTDGIRLNRRHGLQQHALLRALERYGLSLTCADLEEIRRRIVSGRAWKAPGNAWYLCYRGQMVCVSYNPEFDTVATFLSYGVVG